MPEIVPPDQWGRDHWTTIAYAFTCVGKAEMDPRKLREDGEKYPTRLLGGKLLPGHNDYDCLIDAEEARVLVRVKSARVLRVRFTSEGLKLGQYLCDLINRQAHHDVPMGSPVSMSTLTWEVALRESGARLGATP